MLRAAAKRGAAALRGAAPQSPSLPVGMPSRARGMAGASPRAARSTRGVPRAWRVSGRARPHARLFAPDERAPRAGGHGHGQGVEHGGLTLHPPKAWHTNVATGMSALMWCARTRGCAALWPRVARAPRSSRALLAAAVLLDSTPFPRCWTHAASLCRFWVLLRWKEDGSTLIFGHAPHFQHELEEEEKALGVLYAAGKKGGKSGH